LNISPFIQTAFGAIVGGLVVIATSWLNTKREKRKEIQAWYEQRYVTEGIDPLLAYFTGLSFHFLSLPSNNKTIPLSELPVPVEALTRIEILLGINSEMEFLGVFIARVYACLQSAEYYDAATEPLLKLCRILYQLRQVVLELIPEKIDHKNQQLNITYLSDRIALLIMKFVEVTDRLIYKQEPITQE
jgi:hypothetical protein